MEKDSEVPGVGVPIPDDDPRRDYRGMYEDLVEVAGEAAVDKILQQALSGPLAETIEKLYDQIDAIEQEMGA